MQTYKQADKESGRLEDGQKERQSRDRKDERERCRQTGWRTKRVRHIGAHRDMDRGVTLAQGGCGGC